MLRSVNLGVVVRSLERLPQRSRSIVLTCLYGLLAGVATVVFQLAMNGLYGFGLVSLSHQSRLTFALGSLAILLGSSLVVGWLLQRCSPQAAGSGIPQLKLAFWKEFGAAPWRVAWVKFVAGIISVGGGASLGREGPSVQMAGALGSNVAGLLGEAKQSRRLAAAAGAASGLAAAFNTPLAGATFVPEEIIGDLNSLLLGSVLLASVLGALVVHGIVGKQPAFSLLDVDAPSWRGYLLTPVVAALATLVGVCFQKVSLGLRGRMQNPRPVPRWLLPAFGGLTAWLLGTGVFWFTGHLGVFGLGYDDLSSALAGNLGWQLAAVLLAGKFIATCCCYGFGGCGGSFSPTLFLGGMTGIIVAGAVGLHGTVDRPDAVMLAVVGMSACLGAVVWAPVTGILIVFEMTREFALVPALMLAALVSQALSRKLNQENFYDALLTQDGHRLEHVRPPRDLRAWQQLPVSAITNYQPVFLHDLCPANVRSVLKSYPYRQFPVVLDGRLAGALTRPEAEAALAARREPKLEPATVCLRGQTIRELEALLVEATTQLVVVLDAPGGKILGLVTLHDLLRTEVAMAQSGDQTAPVDA